MPDKTYDAVIIGGGKSGLTLGMYLAKYGGMEVGIFEARYELGGGWSCEEAAAGFVGSTHAAHIADWYYLPLEWDFPGFAEMVKWIPCPVAHGAIFSEDQSCVLFYNSHTDPDQEKTWKEIARFSERDADTWVDYWGKWRKTLRALFLNNVAFNPPAPPGVTSPLEEALRDPASGFDPSWVVQTPLGLVRDMFESEAIQAEMLRVSEMATGYGPDVSAGALLHFLTQFTLSDFGHIESGTHSVAHAACKIFLGNGGEVFTQHEVDRVIIENGKARGIKLTDGSEIGARKLVISTSSPQQLVFQLADEEYFDPRTVRRIKNLSIRNACITWYYWAAHEYPDYTAAAFNPDVNDGHGMVALITKDPELTLRQFTRKKLGMNPLPDELPLVAWTAGKHDKTLAPEGKALMGTEVYVVAADQMTEKEWLQFKKSHAEDVIRHWQKYAPNMTWDNIIGYYAFTPWDACQLKSMTPAGTWPVIDNTPAQFGRYRPVPELARYKTPIDGLYAVSAAWSPRVGGSVGGPYSCYKIIAEDLNLDKPWEQEGRPF
jgi:phytoene dehydrogenase-like protein